MATTSFDTTFRINPDWGVKNLKKGLEEYEKNGKKIIVTQLSKYIKYYAREMTGWNLTEEDKPRELLQQLGTNVIREYLLLEDFMVDEANDGVQAVNKVMENNYDLIIIYKKRRTIKSSFNYVSIKQILGIS